MTELPFQNRAQAGQLLAERLAAAPPAAPCVVLALPRGGVPVALPLARRLGAPLELLLVRKIGAPLDPELAVAALVEGDPPELVRDEGLCAATGADPRWLAAQAARQSLEIERQRARYRQGRAALAVQGAHVVVVDDGIATGTTLRAALKALRRRGPRELVLAVPVAPPDVLDTLRAEVDRVVCLAQPEPFHAVGAHYRDFAQVSDAEVLAALHAASAPPSS